LSTHGSAVAMAGMGLAVGPSDDSEVIEMKIIRSAIIAAIAVTGIVTAAPAEATGSRALRGHIEGNFQPTPCPDDSGRVVAWLGTVDVRGDNIDYGWVEFFGESQEGPNYLYFEERWGIFDLGPDGIPDTAEACGPTLIEGDEAGVGFFDPPKAFAFGTVTGDPTFPGVTEGSRMFWAGTVTPDPDTGVPISFEAGIRIWSRR